MATPTVFPKVPVKAWRVLRTRASAAPSTKFTPATVAALLDMGSPKSAADNIVYPLRRLGLLSDEDALTERGNKWRVDSTYAEACQEILDDVYPTDLAALTTEAGEPDKAKVTTWLQHKGFGGSNARQMAATYAMIAGKRPPEAMAGGEPKQNGARNTTAKSSVKSPTRQDEQSSGVTRTSDRDKRSLDHERQNAQTGSGPVIHLDIQIHIPASATAEQIDQIFASMAKHLYRP